MQLRAGVGRAGFGVGHARFERRVHLHIGHIVAEQHSGFLIDIEQVVAKHFAHAHCAGVSQLCGDEIDKFRSTSHKYENCGKRKRVAESRSGQNANRLGARSQWHEHRGGKELSDRRANQPSCSRMKASMHGVASSTHCNRRI